MAEGAVSRSDVGVGVLTPPVDSSGDGRLEHPERAGVGVDLGKHTHRQRELAGLVTDHRALEGGTPDGRTCSSSTSSRVSEP